MSKKENELEKYEAEYQNLLIKFFVILGESFQVKAPVRVTAKGWDSIVLTFHRDDIAKEVIRSFHIPLISVLKVNVKDCIVNLEVASRELKEFMHATSK